jgi:NAD(P)-dependent dehydrogenase (short-subunit alcohol dehydrogenase family)
VDVSEEGAVEQAFADVERELGGVDLLVLNARHLRRRALEETTLDSWRATMAVNLDGAFLLRAARAPGDARPRLRPARGRRLERGEERRPAAGRGLRRLEGRDHDAREEHRARVRRHRMTANAVAPALIDTAMLAGHGRTARARSRSAGSGEPQDVADVVSFLCSAHARYITGEVVDVNGGFLID